MNFTKIEKTVMRMWFEEGCTVGEIALATGMVIMQVTTMINDLKWKLNQ